MSEFNPVDELAKVMKRLKVPQKTERLLQQRIISKQIWYSFAMLYHDQVLPILTSTILFCKWSSLKKPIIKLLQSQRNNSHINDELIYYACSSVSSKNDKLVNPCLSTWNIARKEIKHPAEIKSNSGPILQTEKWSRIGEQGVENAHATRRITLWESVNSENESHHW